MRSALGWIFHGSISWACLPVWLLVGETTVLLFLEVRCCCADLHEERATFPDEASEKSVHAGVLVIMVIISVYSMKPWIHPCLKWRSSGAFFPSILRRGQQVCHMIAVFFCLSWCTSDVSFYRCLFLLYALGKFLTKKVWFRRMFLRGSCCFANFLAEEQDDILVYIGSACFCCVQSMMNRGYLCHGSRFGSSCCRIGREKLGLL